MTMQHVTVMQNSMKAMWKWRSKVLKVSISRLRKLSRGRGCKNVRGKKERKKKKGRRHTHFLLSKHKSSKG